MSSFVNEAQITPETAATARKVLKMSSFWATEMEYRDVSCNKPKLLKIRAKCLNRLRSMLKHGQAKMQDRDEASLNSLETIANARKVLKMSAFVHEARTTEMEDHAETFRPTNPKQPQLPGKGRQSVSSFVNAARTPEMEDTEPYIQPKLPQNSAKFLQRFRSLLEHEQQKRKTRDVSSMHEPETAATAWNVPKMSSFVNAEMEDREASPNEPEIAANPRKVLKMSSFVHEARTTEKESQRRLIQQTGNCHNCLERSRKCLRS